MMVFWTCWKLILLQSFCKQVYGAYVLNDYYEFEVHRYLHPNHNAELSSTLWLMMNTVTNISSSQLDMSNMIRNMTKTALLSFRGSANDSFIDENLSSLPHIIYPFSYKHFSVIQSKVDVGSWDYNNRFYFNVKHDSVSISKNKRNFDKAFYFISNAVKQLAINQIAISNNLKQSYQKISLSSASLTPLSSCFDDAADADVIGENEDRTRQTIPSPIVYNNLESGKINPKYDADNKSSSTSSLLSPNSDLIPNSLPTSTSSPLTITSDNGTLPFFTPNKNEIATASLLTKTALLDNNKGDESPVYQRDLMPTFSKHRRDCIHGIQDPSTWTYTKKQLVISLSNKREVLYFRRGRLCIYLLNTYQTNCRRSVRTREPRSYFACV